MDACTGVGSDAAAGKTAGGAWCGLARVLSGLSFFFGLEVPYHDVLLDFPFKGDEAALRNMEHAELISISTHNGIPPGSLSLRVCFSFSATGRPSAIRPGKPVYKYVFERLVEGARLSEPSPGAQLIFSPP